MQSNWLRACNLSFDMASMAINGWDSSATRRLLQCRDFGLDMMNIWRLFVGSAGDMISDREEYLERKKVIDSVRKHNKKVGS